MKKGFTLIEVLVSTAVIVVCMIGLVSAISSDNKKDAPEEPVTKTSKDNSYGDYQFSKDDIEKYIPEYDAKPTATEVCGRIEDYDSKMECEKEFTRGENIQSCIDRYTDHY